MRVADNERFQRNADNALTSIDARLQRLEDAIASIQRRLQALEQTTASVSINPMFVDMGSSTCGSCSSEDDERGD
jgi:hypothetical protein